MQPLVTAIVLCYNQARFVIESLESVRNQTYKNIQLIIIDDASADGSVNLIRRWIKEHNIDCTFMAHEKNTGISKALNEALSYAKGKYIALLASDDVWMPDKTQDQVRIMEKLDSSFGVIYSDTLVIDEEGSTSKESYMEWHKEIFNLKEIPEGHVFRDLLSGNFVVPATALVRKECYEKVGLYDENLSFEDWDMWLRISQHYKLAFLPSVTTKYRILDYSYFRRLTTTSKCDYLTVLLIMFGKWFHHKKIDEYDIEVLKNTIGQYADLFYQTNCAKRNRYLFTALRYVPSARSLLRYICSILGLNYSSYLKIKGVLYRMKRLYTNLH